MCERERRAERKGDTERGGNKEREGRGRGGGGGGGGGRGRKKREAQREGDTERGGAQRDTERGAEREGGHRERTVCRVLRQVVRSLVFSKGSQLTMSGIHIILHLALGAREFAAC